MPFSLFDIRLDLCVMFWHWMKIVMHCSSTNLCNIVISALVFTPILHLEHCSGISVPEMHNYAKLHCHQHHNLNIV